MISIVIPARNEERFLPTCLNRINSAAKVAQVPVEIIVVLNRCTDRTEEIARAHGCKLVSQEGKNLAAIRNAGAHHATGDFLVTIDADSYMSPKLLADIARCLSNDRIVGGGVMMLPERWSFGIFFTYLALIPVATLYRISAGVFFCRRETFEKLGGFNESWFTAEDIEFARRLRAHGRKNGRKFKTIFSSYIVTSCRKFDEFGDWYALRNPFLFYQVLFNKNKAAGNKYWYDVER